MTTTDMKAALQACVDALLHDGVPTDPYHPRRVALNAAEAALASRPDAQAKIGATGWKLAMRVMQSDLFDKLDDAERAECDALVRANPYFGRSSTADVQADERGAFAMWWKDISPSNFDYASALAGYLAASARVATSQRAFEAVQAVLREVDPKWRERGEFGVKPQEQAIAAIRDLAAAASPSHECGEPPAENADVRNKIAAALHYPDHWDTAAYPTLDDATWEVIAAEKLTCSECGERQECPHDQDDGACGWCYDEKAASARTLGEQSQAAEPKGMTLPEIHGISRMADNPCALLLLLKREPSDDDLRAIHDRIAATDIPQTLTEEEIVDAITKWFPDRAYQAPFFARALLSKGA